MHFTQQARSACGLLVASIKLAEKAARSLPPLPCFAKNRGTIFKQIVEKDAKKAGSAMHVIMTELLPGESRCHCPPIMATILF